MQYNLCYTLLCIHDRVQGHYDMARGTGRKKTNRKWLTLWLKVVHVPAWCVQL